MNIQIFNGRYAILVTTCYFISSITQPWRTSAIFDQMMEEHILCSDVITPCFVSTPPVASISHVRRCLDISAKLRFESLYDDDHVMIHRFLATSNFLIIHKFTWNHLHPDNIKQHQSPILLSIISNKQNQTGLPYLDHWLS